MTVTIFVLCPVSYPVCNCAVGFMFTLGSCELGTHQKQERWTLSQILADVLFLQSCDRRTCAGEIPGSDAYIQNSNSSSSFAALNHIYGSSYERLIKFPFYRNLPRLMVNPTVQCSSFCTTVSDSESLIAVQQPVACYY